MTKTQHDKLVRDRIVEIVERSGRTCVWETLPDERYIRHTQSIELAPIMQI
jgi:predicted house-cleaning noncanonical NTP pyrophosphatase (MazG superfamily)